MSWSEFIGHVKQYGTAPLFHMGETSFSVLSITIIIVASAFVIWLANRIRDILAKKVFVRYHIETGLADAIATIIKYVLLVIGFVIVLESAGINLSSLTVVAGALGVGIGFGLQSITNNFISGIIILFERPIKVGDRIEVGGLQGNVTAISARATIVNTNDNVSVIVPNSEFTTKQVVNWSHNDRMVRFRFPVSVSYKSDPAMVKKALLEVVKENSNVLKHPEPDVLFDAFGESSLDFTLRVWTTAYTDRPRVMKSQLYYAIFKKFAAYNIEIPYPQRDIHIRTEHEKELIVKRMDEWQQEANSSNNTDNN